MAIKSLFISHAEKDQEIAGAIRDMLLNGLAVEAEKVVNIALEEHGTPGGEDFVGHIKSRIGNPDITLLLITKNYLSSRFCLCELGAVWALSHNIIPLIASPIEPRHVKKIVSGDKLFRMDSSDDLNRFVTELQQMMGIRDLNLAKWAMVKKRFIDTIKP